VELAVADAVREVGLVWTCTASTGRKRVGLRLKADDRADAIPQRIDVWRVAIDGICAHIDHGGQTLSAN
jgi:hypothetical protein